jgi:hypothetical protein
MVSIFGMKFFESPSIEEQMHEKGRKRHHSRRRGHKHGPDCQCPICNKKRYRKSRRQGLLKGGYVYNGNDKNISKEDDVTMELSGSKQEKSKVGKGTKRHRHIKPIKN